MATAADGRISGPALTEPQHRALELCAQLPTTLQDRDLTADLEIAIGLLPGLARLAE
jgi:hypothetical protein